MISRYDFTEEEILDLVMSSGDLVNEITVLFAYDYMEKTFRAALTKHNPLSKVIYGTVQKTIECRMLQGTRQAETLADAVLKTSSIPQVICSFTHANNRSILCEVGDRVTLTHRAGIGESGFQLSGAYISKKRSGKELGYEVTMEPASSLYRSELINLSITGSSGEDSITVSYENGVATLTIFADVEGKPPIEGATVIIDGVQKITDKKGQVRFNLLPGRYTAVIKANGYDDAEITFQV